MSMLLARIAARHRGGASVADPYRASVVVDLPLTSDFADTTGRIWTPNGGMTISGGAAVFDGSNDYITTPTTSDFDPGAGDFTIEFFFEPDSSAGSASLFSTRNPGEPHGYQVFDAASLAAWDSSGSYFSPGAAGPSTTGVFQYFAYSQSGANFTMRCGDNVITGTLSSTISAATSSLVGIGRDMASGTRWFNGKMKYLRITKGVARDISVIPSTPYPTV